jgi:hypothetical protein
VRYGRLGRTGIDVSAIGFGAWAIGGSWGATDDRASMAALHAAVDLGVNLIDTADVYGDGHSERLIGRLRLDRAGETIGHASPFSPPYGRWLHVFSCYTCFRGRQSEHHPELAQGTTEAGQACGG